MQRYIVILSYVERRVVSCSATLSHCRMPIVCRPTGYTCSHAQLVITSYFCSYLCILVAHQNLSLHSRYGYRSVMFSQTKPDAKSRATLCAYSLSPTTVVAFSSSPTNSFEKINMENAGCCVSSFHVHHRMDHRAVRDLGGFRATSKPLWIRPWNKGIQFYPERMTTSKCTRPLI